MPFGVSENGARIVLGMHHGNPTLMVSKLRKEVERSANDTLGFAEVLQRSECDDCRKAAAIITGQVSFIMKSLSIIERQENEPYLKYPTNN